MCVFHGTICTVLDPVPQKISDTTRCHRRVEDMKYAYPGLESLRWLVTKTMPEGQLEVKIIIPGDMPNRCISADINHWCFV